jgi:hypothetical protein
MFLFSKPKGKTPYKIFHGGCHGCEVQHTHGTTKCSGCQHFAADWDKPNLNTLDKKMKLWKMRVKFFAFFGIAPLEKPIFHGGCLQCKSQEKHGINRCLGCQYFEADWSKPDLSTK